MRYKIEFMEFSSFSGSLSDLIENVEMDPGLYMLVFYAPWCPSCRRLNQLIPRMIKDVPVSCVYINVDENTKLKDDLEVAVAPTVIFVNNNEEGKYQVLEQMTGNNSKKVRNTLIQYADK